MRKARHGRFGRVKGKGDSVRTVFVSAGTPQISRFRPHDLRYTSAFHLATVVTGVDTFELVRRLGHRWRRCIQRSANPPEKIAAASVEES